MPIDPSSVKTGSLWGTLIETSRLLRSREGDTREERVGLATPLPLRTSTGLEQTRLPQPGVRLDTTI